MREVKRKRKVAKSTSFYMYEDQEKWMKQYTLDTGFSVSDIGRELFDKFIEEKERENDRDRSTKG